MISHKYKCIFIHVPRTGGSSIETALAGRRVPFKEFRGEKHLTASNAKKLYSEYWDDYFTFTIVRNPWDRVVSHYNFSPFRSINALSGKSLKYFLEKYKPYSHEPNPCDYDNIIDIPLDFVGRFENLNEDFKKICKHIGANLVLPHIGKTEHQDYTKYYNKETQKMVQEIYEKDIERYNYQFECKFNDDA